MDMEHQHQLEDVGDDDDGQQQWRRRGKCVPKPEPEVLNDYPRSPHDTIVLTRYNVHVARAATDGEVPINLIL